jgi:hypothetical protein
MGDSKTVKVTLVTSTALKSWIGSIAGSLVDLAIATGLDF